MGGRTIKVVALASLSSFSLQINKAGSWPIFESLKNSIMIAILKKNKIKKNKKNISTDKTFKKKKKNEKEKGEIRISLH